MYVMVSMLFFIRKKAFVKTVVILLFISSYFFTIFQPYFLYGVFVKIGLGSNHFYNLMCFFAGGMVLTYLKINEPV